LISAKAISELRAIATDANVRDPGNPPCHIGNIAVKAVANLAEDREGQISFTPLDSSKETPVQPTILGKPFWLNPRILRLV
jgi:hypothetical protein